MQRCQGELPAYAETDYEVLNAGMLEPKFKEGGLKGLICNLGGKIANLGQKAAAGRE